MASARDLLVRFLGDAADLKKKAKEAEQATAAVGKSADTAGGKLPGLQGKVSSLVDDIKSKVPGASGAMDLLGKSSDDVAGSLTGAGGAAAAAGTAVAGAAVMLSAKGVQAFMDLSQEVLKFKRIAGTTAEESSQWVEVAGDYGVSADAAAGAVGKLEKAIANTPAAVEALGVAIVHNADGTVNMQQTMLNAADAFSKTTDEAERAKIGSTLFGKSWQDMVPILEQGADGLKKSFADVKPGKILSADDLKNGEEFRLALDDIKDAGEALMIQVGRGLVPALKDLASTAGDVTAAFDAIPGGLSGIIKLLADVPVAPLKAVDTTAHGAGDAIGWLSEKITHNKAEARAAADTHQALADAAAHSRVEHQELADALGTAEAATRNAYKATHDAADIEAVEAQQTKEQSARAKEFIDDLKARENAQKRATQALKDNTDEVRAEADAGFALRRSQRDLDQQFQDTADAVDKANRAHGRNVDANVKAGQAQDDLKQKVLDNAEAYARSTGAVDGSKASIDAQKTKLAELRDQYATKFPEIAAFIQEYIDKLNAAQTAASHVQIPGYDSNYASRDASGGVQVHAAIGGVFRARGGGYNVNLAEAGRDEAVVGLTTNGAIPIELAGGGGIGGQALTINMPITVQGGVWHVEDLADALQSVFVRKFRFTNGQVFVSNA